MTRRACSAAEIGQPASRRTLETLETHRVRAKVDLDAPVRYAGRPFLRKFDQLREDLFGQAQVD